MTRKELSRSGSTALINCWPFETSGPLPLLLDDIELIGEAFFEFLPTFKKLPASAVRRGLKLTAKRLGIPFDRSNTSDQRARDYLLAYEFAARATGRDALRSISLVFETPRQGSRRGRRDSHKLGVSLPEILWMRYSQTSTESDLGDWATRVGVPRPDLGDAKAFYLTAEVLEKSLTDDPPPRPLSDVDLARLVLLFAAILPRDEALALMKMAAARGMNALEIADLQSDLGNNAVVDASELPEIRDDFRRETFPTLGAPPSLVINLTTVPAPTAEAKLLSSQISSAQQIAVGAEQIANASLTVGDLLALDHVDYLSQIEAIKSARSSQEKLTAAIIRGREFISVVVSSVVVSAKLAEPRWLSEVADYTPSDLADAVLQASSLGQLAQMDIHAEVTQTWRPDAATNLQALVEAFRELPSRNEHVVLLSNRERDYVTAVRRYLKESDPSVADIGIWFRQLSDGEINSLLDNIELAEWPMLVALLTRLGVDSGLDGVAKCAARLININDRKARRDLLHFMDPTFLGLDGNSDFQRVIVAERLRDTLRYGPLVAITDPSLRLTEVGLVGVPLSSLFELLIHHLDLIGNSVELRRLATLDGQKGAASDSVEADLIAYATNAATSSGLYLQLREAVRESYFLPIVVSGAIDHSRVAALAATFDVEDAIESAVAKVGRENHRFMRIEPRHRARVLRYVRYGRELLDSYVHSKGTSSESRRRDFRADLSLALAQLNSEPAPIGSNPWLESEVCGMLLQPTVGLEFPTLIGCPLPVPNRTWMAADTEWALQSIQLPEFFVDAQISTLDIAAKVVRAWGLNEKPKADQVVSELLIKKQFLAARAFVEEEVEEDSEREDLYCTISTAADVVAQPIRERVEILYGTHGKDLLKTFTTHAELEVSLEDWRFNEAAEQLEFLEMEVAEKLEFARKEAIDASEASERNALLCRLLQAGVEGPDERWSLAELESRWAAEYTFRSDMRAHLRPVEKALEAGNTLPELADDAREFARHCEDPATWLPADRASDFLSLVEGPAEKLRTWLQLADQLTPPAQRPALIEVTRYLVRFIHETATALRLLDAGGNSDNILERALEVEYVFEQSADPIACAQGLGLTIDEAGEHQVSPPAVSVYDDNQFRAALTPLAERGDWLALAEAAREYRMNANDEDARRLADVAEFAETLHALDDGRISSARDGMVTSAKGLGATGHFISRALPSRRQQAIAFDLIAATLVTTDVEIRAMSPQQDGAWLKLVDRRWGLLQSLSDGGLTAKVLEQLCSGTFGREVVNRLWDAPTSTAEPGPFRAALLKFLHDRGLDEHLLFLAARHEPSLHSRFGQLLNLRKIVSQRPDLLPVSEAVASEVARAAQGVPFRTFVQDLPTAAQTVDADLEVSVDNDIILRIDRRKPTELSVSISISPRGLVPESLEVILFSEDDVSFDDDTRRRMLSSTPVYFPTEYNVAVRFGESWNDAGSRADVNFRIRVNARVLAGELISRDVVCQVTRAELHSASLKRIDDETLLDTFPGVENTPAAGDSFIGRVEELERLHGALVSARRPSPVLLTGMRRIGKTSLLYKFHDRHRQPRRDAPLTVYFTLAERRAPMMDPNQSVSSVFLSAITQALGKRHFSSTDLNRELGEKLRQTLGSERDAVRNAIIELRDPDSLADSLTVLSERLLEWAGGASRVIYLIDEAETLVLPYRGSEAKRLELQQLMQGLREVSQTSPKVGLLLSGSNHIAEFARSYKNAFFGSSLQIDLAGMTDLEIAKKLVSPTKLKPYIAFSGDPVRYAIEMCAGMPQFLWHLGAAIAAIVRTGPVTKSDVRHAVSALIGVKQTDLPFTAYDVLEPIEHMLGLQGQREQDLLWLALWRVANSSSLLANEAQLSYIIDQSLIELDEFDAWKARLLSLVDLEILQLSKSSMFGFRVPIFAEGFRAPRREHDYHLRHQRAAT